MRVRMLVKISGGRGDGTDWPDPGGEVDLGDEEGRHLCTAGLAVPVPVEERAETTDAPVVDVEERAATPKRSSRGKS